MRLPGPDDFPKAGPFSLASIAQRGAGRFLDVLIVFVPVFVLLVLTQGEALEAAEQGRSDEFAMPTWLIGVWAALLVVYETVLIAWRGQTIGKFAVGVRVARYADGKSPTPSQAALRALLPATSFVFFAVIGLLGFDWVFFMTALPNVLRRGWHDIAGGTVVVRTR